ncbi:MAG: Serine phosphatase RsbU, regulator of sigma subunit [Candidatus Ozemobacter sibiricus]|uniref:Serine phosphatase RsbU, regulator of sigma subunit n=1 Tax=Candidatus Ozemobacter sibiricus TaxID=2268124 RepID=A0A367ZW23_9BACT|nr:MAG: Serine phosphatase RsbU, regulator of sigma subunit [Candidatus Ozemobacter sibiricus]
MAPEQDSDNRGRPRWHIPATYLAGGILVLGTAIGLLFLHDPPGTRFAPLRLFSLAVVVFSSLLVGIISYWTYSCWQARQQATDSDPSPQADHLPSLDFSDLVLQPQAVVRWYETNLARYRDRCTTLERISQLLSFMDYSRELPRQLKVALHFGQEIFPDAVLAIFLPEGADVRVEIASQPDPAGGVQFLTPGAPLLDELLAVVRDQIDLDRLHVSDWQTFSLPRRAGRSPALQSILPLAVWNRIRGILVLHSLRGRAFTADDLVLASLLCRQIALFLENHLLYQDHLTQQRLLQEVEIARSVQSAALPPSSPAFPGFEICGICTPSREISGDYYDLIPRADGSLAVAVADVSGKGLPAALFLSKIQTLVRASVDAVASPGALLTLLSRQIARENLGTLFATMVVAFLRPNSPRIVFASAGHCRPLVVHTRQGFVEDVQTDVGIPLGLFDTPDGEYLDMVLDLMPGDGVLLFTDGLTDATNPARERYGHERLKLSAERAPTQRAAEFVDHLMADLHRFKGPVPLEDDTTIVYFRWEPSRV